MNHYFTSDTHAWHENIIKYCNRPFANAEEMTRKMADNINSIVAPGDTLVHAGDFAMGTPAMITHFREMINCKNIILILGNHDKRIRGNKQLQGIFTKVHGTSDRNFAGVDFKINGQHIIVCHYAMRVWDSSHSGFWHLYGHSHGTLPDDPNSLSFDCGVDCWDFKPVYFEQIAERMAKKTYKPVDHHDRERYGNQE